MNTKTTEPQQNRQLCPFYYEPTHDPETTEQVRLALALRGYELTRDESSMPDMLTVAWAMVTVEGDGSLTLHDGDVGTALPKVEEFPSPAVYAMAIAQWLDGDFRVAPSELAEAVTSWPVRRSETFHRVRMMRRSLDEIERHARSEVPDQYRSGSPAKTIRQMLGDLAEECQRLTRELTDEVPEDLAASARAELAGREALAALQRSLNGGAR